MASCLWTRQRCLDNLGMSESLEWAEPYQTFSANSLQEWEHQLRSSLHPMLFGAVYVSTQWVMSSMSFFPEFQALMLPVIPRAVQSLFAALGDLFTWRLARKLYGLDSNAAFAALWMTILNPWQWYCSTRTFSNSLETTLTIVALYYWPWEVFADAGQLKAKVLSLPHSILR
jgi:GPI mannosyltransferase 3